MVDTPLHKKLKMASLDLPAQVSQETDVGVYAQGYAGPMRLARLLFIANELPELRGSAFHSLAHELRQNTTNVALYTQVYQLLSDSYTNDAWAASIPPMDHAWVEQTQQHNRETLEQLESELKSHRNHLLKDSVRLGYLALGEFYLQTGDTNAATKCYLRAREYCAHPSQYMDLFVRLMTLGLLTKQWPLVTTYLQRLNTYTFKNKLTPALQEQVLCIQALLHIRQGSYAEAVDHLAQLPQDPEQFSPQILSTTDVATLAVLCALADHPRSYTQALLHQNPRFKLYLETSPLARPLATAFHRSQFNKARGYLDMISRTLAQDMFLAEAAPLLQEKIQMTMLLAYIRPYSVVDIHQMATAFEMTSDEVEQHVFDLLRANRLTAQIDGQTKVIYCHPVAAHCPATREAALMQLGAQATEQTQLLATQVHLRENDIEVLH
ncbi:cop9 signalosome complex subunit [Dimargaris xerosporica]|nr:cop9 signalosome complex subunit [Dimargaris xerosporica]